MRKFLVYATAAVVAVATSAGAGGDLVSQNAKLGYAVARSSSASFATNVDKSPAVIGAARNRVIRRRTTGATRSIQRR